MHITEAMRIHGQQLRANGRSDHTCQQYDRHIGLFAQWLAGEERDPAIEAIDPGALSAFLTSDVARCRADGRPRTPSSQNILRSSLRAFFGFLCEAGYLAQNPARLVRRTGATSTPPRALTDVELESLRDALADPPGIAGVRDRVLVEFLLATGLRLSAALSLQVEDLDLGARLAWIRRGKRGQQIRVVLPSGIVPQLERWLQGQKVGALFDVGARQAQHRFAAAVRRAGLRPGITLHSLRHTFATRLYDSTGDILLVQEALHHRSISSTLVYARCDEARLRVALGG